MVNADVELGGVLWEAGVVSLAGREFSLLPLPLLFLWLAIHPHFAIVRVSYPILASSIPCFLRDPSSDPDASQEGYDDARRWLRNSGIRSNLSICLCRKTVRCADR